MRVNFNHPMYEAYCPFEPVMRPNEWVAWEMTRRVMRFLREAAGIKVKY